MSFVYPLGLLGLLAIPILIIIYIIKNKYTEQVISATYLWTLSEKFLKRKNPLNRLTGIISLILQILAVVLISLAVAHPVFTLKNAAEDYCFILDGSGSMNIVRNGETRLEQGKAQIKNLIDDSVNGSGYTLVYACDTSSVVYENITDKQKALALLKELQPEYRNSNVVSALTAAQKYFNENPSVKTYLVTDKSFEESGNVSIINVSDGEENYAVSDVKCNVSGGLLTVDGKLYSYTSDKTLTVGLYINGADTPAATQQIEVKKSVEAPFSFESNVIGYTSVRVAIEDKDALALDNECTVYNVKNDTARKMLIVSETPFRLQATLGFGNADAIKPEEYAAQTGYGLYVFDSYTPETLPKDAAVWFVNPVSSVENSGFSVQSEINLDYAVLPEYSKSSATTVSKILDGVVKRDEFRIKKYVKCGLYRNFSTVLSHNGAPLIFAGTNTYGNREVVLAFSLQDTDVTVSINFPIIMQNLINYTFPVPLEETSYVCGDVMHVNVPANCDSIRVDTPLGNVSYVETGVDIADYTLTEVGTYTVTLMSGNAASRINVFSELPASERFTEVTESSFIISGEAEHSKRDGVYDDLLAIFIILAVVFIADWMVYCYEQYQLR